MAEGGNLSSKLFSILVILLILLNLMSFETVVTQGQTINSNGYLEFTGITVERINLAVKEIDVKIGILRVGVNRPFNMIVWAPFRIGGPIYFANGTRNADGWYYFTRTDWGWLKFLTIKTIGFLGINNFPFEIYETEIIFGFSVNGIKPRISSKPGLSWELEQQGYWIVEAKVENTSSSRISEICAKYEKIIEAHKIKSFISLFIRLKHPDKFWIKMIIPTWGPIIIMLLVIVFQFWPLKRKMDRNDHITMFLAFSIFMLSTSFAIREMTPPELTWPELLSFLLVIVYMMILFLVIYKKLYLMKQKY